MKLIILTNILILFTFIIRSAECLTLRPRTKRPRKEKIVFVPPKIKPKLLIFNLDRTIWPIIMDELELPYKINRKQIITDDCNNRLSLFPHTLRMLQDLRRMKFKMAALCYFNDFSAVDNLLKLMKVSHMFDYKEFSYNSKFDQIEKIQNVSKIQFNEMILFDLDNEEFNELELFDILTFRIEQKGVLLEHIQAAWTMFAKKRSQEEVQLPEDPELDTQNN